MKTFRLLGSQLYNVLDICCCHRPIYVAGFNQIRGI